MKWFIIILLILFHFIAGAASWYFLNTNNIYSMYLMAVSWWTAGQISVAYQLHQAEESEVEDV